ncbi:MAG: signal peptidase II [Deltaproteobacteria bacterium]|jgi:signal peptidase II|nr:signal peptidase II [Deltaproteobacteria bacterium]
MLRKKILIALAWVLLAFVLDFLTKRIVLHAFALGETREVTGFFNLVFVTNSGAAFNLFSGEGSRQGLKMAILALIALVPLAWFFLEAGAADRFLLSGLGLILGGAAGNVHDRLHYGVVVDFLDFHWGPRHWPAFNVADIAICVGVGIVILSVLWRPGGEKAPKGAKKGKK